MNLVPCTYNQYIHNTIWYEKSVTTQWTPCMMIRTMRNAYNRNDFNDGLTLINHLVHSKRELVNDSLLSTQGSYPSLMKCQSNKINHCKGN